MFRKTLKVAAIAVGVLFVGITAVVGYWIHGLWHGNTYKTVVQTLDWPRENARFVLMTDIAGFGDRAWYVYRLAGGAVATAAMNAAHDKTGVLFWNYAEAGHHVREPRIDILKDRYLVFSRGGLRHSLYDLKTRELLVNETAPWGSYVSANRNQTPGGKEMRDWVRTHLDTPIGLIVNGKS